MRRFLIGYLATALTMLILDAAWLSTMTPRLYRPRLAALMADKPSVAPAVVFYLLYVAAVVILAVLPAFREASWRRLMVNAAVFGLAAYGAYDLTNQATLKAWPTAVTVADMAWGVVITTAAAAAGFAALQRFAK